VRRIATLLLLATFVVALGGCDMVKDIFGSDKKVKLKGERIPVMLFSDEVKPDPGIQDLEVKLPEPQTNPAWPQSGGNPDHDMQNLALSDSPKEVFSVSIGSGKSAEWKHLASPVMAEGRIFTMDTDSTVTAFDAGTGARIWRTDATPDSDDIGSGDVGGGVAYADGQLYVTNNYGEALALDAKSGKIVWRRALGGPTRAAPTIAGGRVFVVTADNQLHALSVKDGSVQWTHAGLAEVTGVLGAASPAYETGLVAVPYTSGEVYGLRPDNGRVLWSDTLAAIRPSDSVSSLADIRANPVIDRGRLIVIGHSGRMEAIDLRTGGRAWDDPIGGISMPWVAGDFIFVISTDNRVICLTRDEGRIRWLTQLDRWLDAVKKRNPILWLGPVLGGGKLIITSNDGRILAVSPANGAIMNTIDAGDPISVSPIIANGTLYVLTDVGDLKAYR
jgi:outer membrane protein assembly factor BamB